VAVQVVGELEAEAEQEDIVPLFLEKTQVVVQVPNLYIQFQVIHLIQ